MSLIEQKQPGISFVVIMQRFIDEETPQEIEL